MTPQEIDRTIRRIAQIATDITKRDWDMADELAKMSDEEYERSLARIVGDTHWSRQKLTAYRMTALVWTPDKRFPQAPFFLHQQYRYRPEVLRRQVETGTIGQDDPVRKRQREGLTAMSQALRSVNDILEDPRLGNKEKLDRIAAAVRRWRYMKQAA